MTRECFACTDVRECSFYYLEADELARFLAVVAGNRLRAQGLSAMFAERAEELHRQGLPNAAQWATRLSGDLASAAEAEWADRPTAEKRDSEVVR